MSRAGCLGGIAIFIFGVAGCSAGGSNERIAHTIPDPLFREQPKPPPARRVTQAPPRRVRVDQGLSQVLGLPRYVIPPGGIRRNWKYIVIHHSATATGGASRFHYMHKYKNGWDELGYHFVIGNGTDTPDGYLEIGPRWLKQKHGAHCKTPGNEYNEHGVGICLVGNFENSYATNSQLAMLEKLVSYLMRTCHIPLSNIESHGGVTHKTACPGRNFSLSNFKKRLTARASR